MRGQNILVKLKSPEVGTHFMLKDKQGMVEWLYKKA